MISYNTKTRQLKGDLRGRNQHLARDVVTNLSEVSLSFMTSQKTAFQNCVFWHTLSEKRSKQK